MVDVTAAHDFSAKFCWQFCHVSLTHSRANWGLIGGIGSPVGAGATIYLELELELELERKVVRRSVVEYTIGSGRANLHCGQQS